MTNETETAEAPPEPAITDSWREALATRKTQQAGGTIVPAAAVSRPPIDVSRRRFILASFWTGLGVSLAGTLGFFLDFFYPRGVAGFGGPVAAGNVKELPKGGIPKQFAIGAFWLVNLDPEDVIAGSRVGSDGGSGLLALWRKCPHLGCSVPWRSGFRLKGEEGQGWFRCPCHGSTYNKAGVRIFGPAPRPMDTMQIDIDEAGNITVQTGVRSNGGEDNPQRAIQHPLLPG